MRWSVTWVCATSVLATAGIWQWVQSGCCGVVFGRKVSSVTSQALFAVVGDALFGGRLVVRIVTTGAGHRVARFPLAHALRQRLDLADPAQPALLSSGQDVIADVIGKRLPRLKLIGMPAGTLNRYFAFQMTLHAYRIAAIRREPGRVHNRSRRAGDVRCSRAVAALAADAGMEKCRHWGKGSRFL